MRRSKNDEEYDRNRGLTQSLEKLTNALGKHNLKVSVIGHDEMNDEIIFETDFASPAELMRHLKAMGFSFSQP